MRCTRSSRGGRRCSAKRIACAGSSAADRPQIERVAAADPHGAVAMIAKLVTRVRMKEHVELAVIEREPADDLGKLNRRERKLIARLRMRSDGALVKSSERHTIAEMGGDGFAQCLRRVAPLGVEVHMRVPARNA